MTCNALGQYNELILSGINSSLFFFSSLDYAFPYIILVLSLVTLAVYMSASEIQVRHPHNNCKKVT